MNDLMNFSSGSSRKGAKIRPILFHLAEIPLGDMVTFRVAPGVVVMTAEKLSALELLEAAKSLKEMAAELCTELTLKCGKCVNCDEECPYGPEDFGIRADVPDELRERAGIPEDADVFVNVEDGRIVLAPDDGPPGLRDVPKFFLDGFLEAGRCPADLEILLTSQDNVFDE